MIAVIRIIFFNLPRQNEILKNFMKQISLNTEDKMEKQNKGENQTP